MLRVSKACNNAKQPNLIQMNKYYIVGNTLHEQKPENASKDAIYTVTCTSIDGATEFLRMLQRARLENPELK